MLDRYILFPLILVVVVTLPVLLHGQTGEQGLSANLIAHRGGIVNAEHAENSRSAIEEAIQRGYWMLEIDLRKTKDDRIIIYHDPTFQKYYNDSRAVSEMEWNEIRKLRSRLDGSRPLLFEEAAEIAQDHIKLMLDIKGGDFDESSYEQIEQILKKYDLLSSTFVLSDANAQQYFHGKASVSKGLDEIIRAAVAGENVGNLYHLFELGGNLDQQMIEKANQLGVKVVAAINVFRYHQPHLSEEQEWEAAGKDVERLMKLGVEYYQVDSVYEPLFRED